MFSFLNTRLYQHTAPSPIMLPTSTPTLSQSHWPHPLPGSSGVLGWALHAPLLGRSHGFTCKAGRTRVGGSPRASLRLCLSWAGCFRPFNNRKSGSSSLLFSQTCHVLWSLSIFIFCSQKGLWYSIGWKCTDLWPFAFLTWLQLNYTRNFEAQCFQALESGASGMRSGLCYGRAWPSPLPSLNVSFLRLMGDTDSALRERPWRVEEAIHW